MRLMRCLDRFTLSEQLYGPGTGTGNALTQEVIVAIWTEVQTRASCIRGTSICGSIRVGPTRGCSVLYTGPWSGRTDGGVGLPLTGRFC